MGLLPLIIGTSLALTYLMRSGMWGKCSAVGGGLFGTKAAAKDAKLKASAARKEISDDSMLLFCGDDCCQVHAVL